MRAWLALGLTAVAVTALLALPAQAEPPAPEPMAAADRPAGGLPMPPAPAPFLDSGRTLSVSPAGPYRTVGEALAAAQPGDTLAIAAGTYQEHLTVAVPVRLVGAGEGRTILDGGGAGTVLTVTAPRVEVTGLVIRGTGDNLAAEDAAVMVTAPGAYIHGNRIEQALFGIYLRKADHARIAANAIQGMAESLGLRGDAIRLWYSPASLVEGNRVTGGRDVMVWFSDQSIVRQNVMTGGRYGLHFMWSNDGTIEENRLEGNSVGIFVMYSDRITVRRNTIRSNRGPSGYGLALKDAQYLTAEQNWLVDNRVGIYLDNAPYGEGAWNRFAQNVVAENEIGLLLMPATHDNTFTENDLVENGQQVHLTTEGSLGPNEWAPGGAGNYWSDYAGYDAGGDGRGDLPYRSVSLFEDLMARYSAFRWFGHSPAALAVDAAARAFPAVAPEAKMTDPAPAMAPHLAGGYLPADGGGHPGGLAGASAAMVAGAALLALMLKRGWGRRDLGAGRDQSVRQSSRIERRHV